MPTVEQLRKRLSEKLAELFQLNQPDLDFGFYRIMHAKAKEVDSFIKNDLLQIVTEAFANVGAQGLEQLQKEYESAVQKARDYGSPEPENAPKVKEIRQQMEALKNTSSSEAEVYDLLFRFFERYYDGGDFISRRYYIRETEGRAAPFAVPYYGEEVKLHWANADQYYIKTTEFFSNFSFDLLQSKEFSALDEMEKMSLRLPEKGKRVVHFRVVDASEGEHGNIKAADDKKRFFILKAEQPVALTEAGELEISFEFRVDPEKSGQENTWREKRNQEAEQGILSALEELAQADTSSRELAGEFLRLLKIAAPTEANAKRSVLAKYLNQYTARNTMDYFIHKDLGGFLSRELDFYIKNEVMHLDDIENADVPAVESYLSKIKVLRKIAGKLIDFLAQLEDFQKKLWLKKKFVVETNYCITLDRVPEELYAEIAANEAQLEEWVKLFAIDEIKAVPADLLNETGRPGFSRPLSIEFLKSNDKLVLDTRFFSADFKARLIASIQNFDEQCDGVLIHSENFQALNLLQERYREQIKCIYIDPPYNANSSEILYKNSYRDSSWISLIIDRLELGKKLLAKNCSNVIAIDEVEQENLGKIINMVFTDWVKACISIMHNPRGQQGKNISYTHEFAYFIYPSDSLKCLADVKRNEIDSRTLRDSGTDSRRSDARTCFYPFFVKDNKIIGIGEVPDDNIHPSSNVFREDGILEIWPIDDNGVERKWRYSCTSVCSIMNKLVVKQGRISKQIIFNKDTGVMRSLWADAKYDASEYGTKVLQAILGIEGASAFSYPKSIYTVKEALQAQFNNLEEGVALDYFAGSGTTGHAVININRECGGKRKYILVEMGDYFDTVLKPRIEKVIYSENWKDGKPTTRHSGISQCVKYIRLESYEDTLNNLRFESNTQRDRLLEGNARLREDHILRYMLDVETKGSQSLLNIDAFAHPDAYSMEIKKPGSDSSSVMNIDLVETFNYLIGLRVAHYAAPQSFNAAFKRVEDPELPEDKETRLVLDGRLHSDAEGSWTFRKIEGWVPANPYDPSDGEKERVLIVWRNLTGDLEKDNLMLDEWFKKNRISTHDSEFDTIYVNGSNNLSNLKQDGETWKVRLIEEEFMKRMWNSAD